MLAVLWDKLGWDRLGGASSLPARALRWLLMLGLLFLIFESVTIDFNWPEQLVLGILTIAIGVGIGRRFPNSYVITLTLMFLSLIATMRYAYWRLHMVANVFIVPGNRVSPLDMFFMSLLVLAESYAFVILFLGYFQTIRPLRRKPVALPLDVEQWPHVDLLIPTYNEPLSIVRYTALAASNIDYPAEKLHVYILDDGRREEFRDFAQQAGIGYITRDNNRHAKAGNINQALSGLDSTYVSIFDCDHVPTRSFLQVTIGWFLRDTKLGMLQTPHHFYSPDPFERNLRQFRQIPNENELFYGIVQDGNDFWNAAFFCGSCAVIRRDALDQVGGIATETVTEDAHTSLRLQMRGWNTAYINIPQAAGLATERLSGHVGQRIRWARGMTQILRTDNPLFAPGLDWPQRLCYFNAMAHFMYALPRLIFLTAPLIYMLMGHTNIPGHWAAILAYAFPHLVLSNVTNSRIQGEHRHSFWNEVYETVLAPYILLPTLLALINPKLGKFNVTDKGGVVEEGYFDARIARPFVVMLMFNFAGVLVAPWRFFVHDTAHPGTVLMNLAWLLFNIVILGTATAVAYESQQRRSSVRVSTDIAAGVRLGDGRVLNGRTIDLSSGGAALHFLEPLANTIGEYVTVFFPLTTGKAELPARVVGVINETLRLEYTELSLDQQEALTLVLYSRADAWVDWGGTRPTDRPLHSLLLIFKLSLRGLRHTVQDMLSRKPPPKPAAVATATLCLLAIILSPFAAAADSPVNSKDPAAFHSSFTLKQVGLTESIELRGIDASHTVTFALPHTQVVNNAALNLRYAYSPGLLPQLSHLNVLVNGTLFATLPVPPRQDSGQSMLSTRIVIPSDLLVRNNSLTFEFIGHYTLQCEDPGNTVLWARVDSGSSIELNGTQLPLTDDLQLLPLPFYDDDLRTESSSIPFIFLSPPSNKALAAAGAVASWFGVAANSRPLHFPVSIGTIPKGNVVLLIESNAHIPEGLHLEGGPAIAVRTNPGDPYGKVLVILGEDSDQLLMAARGFASQKHLLQGNTVQIADFQMPTPRLADDAPRWLPTDRLSPLWDYTTADEMQSDGSGPMAVYLRTAPDLFFAEKTVVPLQVNYRYNAIPLANASTLRISANGSLVNEVPLPHGTEAAASLSRTVLVPVINLRPSANTFLFTFYFQIAKKGFCQDTTPGNLIGGILRDSYLDMRGLRHWATMPNLELFANAGFPFTRLADLADTTVVLPPSPSVEEIALYLAIMGHFGAQTGYPALRVTVDNASALGAADRDYLILGKPEDQPAFARLNNIFPVTIEPGAVRVRDSNSFFAPVERAWWRLAEMRPAWWWKSEGDDQAKGKLSNLGDFPEGVIEASESPWGSGRSVVAIAIKEDSAEEPFVAAFLKASQSGDISDSVSVLQGDRFDSFPLGTALYHVGEIPWWLRIQLLLTEYPWSIVLLALTASFLLASWASIWIVRRARVRLRLVGTA